MEKEDVNVRVVKGTGFLFLGAIIGYLTSFFYRIILARGLDPSSYGIFSLVVTLIGIFTTIFSLGISEALTKFISENTTDKTRTNRIFSTGAIIIFVTALTAALLMFLLSDFFATTVFNSPLATTPFRIGALALFFTLANKLYSGVLKGYQRMGLVSISNLTEKVSKLAFTLLFFYLNFELFGAVWAYTISFFCMSTFLYFAYKHTTKLKMAKFNPETSKRLLRFGVPLLISLVASSIFGWTDTFFIGVFRTSADVGQYNAALPVVGILAMVAIALGTAMFPAISQINAKKDKEKIASIMNRSLKYAIYFILPAATGAILLAENLIILLFTTEYARSILPFKLLGIVAVFISLIAILRNFMAGMGKPKKIMQFMLIGTGLNVVLNCILIPFWGLEGAAIATIISVATLTGLMFVYSRKLVRIRTKFLYKPVVASAVMAGAILLIKLLKIPAKTKIPLMVVFGAIVYFVVLICLKGFDKRDKELLRSLFSRKKKAKL